MQTASDPRFADAAMYLGGGALLGCALAKRTLLGMGLAFVGGVLIGQSGCLRRARTEAQIGAAEQDGVAPSRRTTEVRFGDRTRDLV